ncbi:MAG: E2 protein [Melanogrammus aeglefinus-associated papillomavirus 1]|nr:MAG: E2 protein [Melanogrammus aeglefinus-associated papillomavirus 1]
MSTIKALHEHEVALHKQKKKIKDLKKCVDYLTDHEGFLHNCILYKSRNGVSHKTATLHQGKHVMVLPSDSQLKHELEQVSEVSKAFTRLYEQKGNIPGFNPQDTDYSSYVKSPSNVIKRGGQYDERGYPVYSMFYVPSHRNVYVEEKPQSDDRGFYFLALGQRKHYFFLFQPDSDEEEPQLEPSAKVAKPVKTKTTPKRAPSKTVAKRAPSVPAPSKSKVLLGRTGHGLSRLLAEAKDPPIVEFEGTLEEIKGFRKRAEKKYHHLISRSSTTYTWKLGSKRFMFQFSSYAKRSQFLDECTLRIPKYRLGAFDTK